MWTCPKCASKVDPSFEICWNCGTSPDGIADPSFVRADDTPPIEDPPAIAPEFDVDGDLVGSGDLDRSIGGDLVEAYKALDLMEAQFLAEQLNEAKIPAVSDTHDMHESFGSWTSRPRIWVREEDLARARTWLEAYEQDKKASTGS